MVSPFHGKKRTQSLEKMQFSADKSHEGDDDGFQLGFYLSVQWIEVQMNGFLLDSNAVVV